MRRNLPALLIWLCSASLAVSAQAQTYSSGTELWSGYRVGMTKAEAGAVDQAKKFELSDGCRVKLDLDFNEDRLFQVKIWAQYASAYNDASCTDIIFSSLSAKYGPPNNIERSGEMSSSLDTRTDNATWIDGERSITLASYVNGRFKVLIYSPLIRPGEKKPLIDNL